MSEPLAVNDDEFDQIVLQSEIPVLVDFWAPWCQPCLMIAPILDELAEEFSGRMNIVRVDVDQNLKSAVKYSIMAIPSLLIFRNGKLITNVVGAKRKQDLKQIIDDALK
ncbi:MAG TPA: thioredoxin [Dehalococcoidia bacterium]|jgi:thioredoxin 1|nr:thioredoxin [Dehalococcoidia bacterium]